MQPNAIARQQGVRYFPSLSNERSNTNPVGQGPHPRLAPNISRIYYYPHAIYLVVVVRIDDVESYSQERCVCIVAKYIPKGLS